MFRKISPKIIKCISIYVFTFINISIYVVIIFTKFTGSKWCKRRKIITPGFHYKLLEQFIEIFNAQSDTLVKQIHAKSPIEPLDIVPLIKLAALDIICETALGKKLNVQIEPDCEYLRAVQKASDIIHHRSFDSLAHTEVYFQMTRNARIFQKCIATIHGFTDNVITNKRDVLLKNRSHGKLNFNFDECGPRKKMAFIDILLNSTVDGKSLTNEEIRDEIVTLMFAGHETITSGVSFLLYNLAKYSDIQSKVFDEIMEQCKSSHVSYKQLTNFKYLDMVVKESLRIFPPTPMIGRQIVKDVEISR